MKELLHIFFHQGVMFTSGIGTPLKSNNNLHPDIILQKLFLNYLCY